MVKASEIFGELTFNRYVMKEKLSKNCYEKIIATLDNGAVFDEEILPEIADAMKEWAIENGATHFTHWFQPRRGGTAEKHDSFISYGENGEMIESFSAKQLIQSEPDASSFPSGGIRSTAEARGYTAWDPTSPAFLIKAEDTTTFVIPSVFLSWTGEVLDIKTPLLRSMAALNDSGIKLQRLLGNRMAKKIKVFAGPEQEYFLVSKAFVGSRPDLAVCNRTLFGAPPAKGQQMEDHYFGYIKGKVLRFMEALDIELYRRGIPSKTRHNEVAPNQFEIAPLYEEANLAIDHNLQLMDIMKHVADQHDMHVILHEKPFAGVNGSGKHLNWSIGDNTGANYFEPSKSPLKNITFLLTLAAIFLGVDKMGGVLRAAVADAGNDHRLGANEAPPAIMSVYLGEYLDTLLSEIEGITKITDKQITSINLGVQNLPKVMKDTSDRNRTSPIAFTGNKFEFRAVGSSHNCAEAATVFNMLVTYGYDVIIEKLQAMNGDVKENAILVLKDILKSTKRVRFEGNNYSQEWTAEASGRGLPNDKSTPAALAHYLNPEIVELYRKYKILSEKELHAKLEIKLENYIKVKEIEYKTALDIAITKIQPALARHIAVLGDALSAVSICGIKPIDLNADLEVSYKLYSDIKSGISGLASAIHAIEEENDINKKAMLCADIGIPALADLRSAVDSAELVVADDLWPMVKYRELLTVL